MTFPVLPRLRTHWYPSKQLSFFERNLSISRFHLRMARQRLSRMGSREKRWHRLRGGLGIILWARGIFSQHCRGMWIRRTILLSSIWLICFVWGWFFSIFGIWSDDWAWYDSSGFDREDEWGFRALEPSRCCISSIALVLLKTGIVHHPGGTKPVEVDYQQMATAQKLLLFWRKPAVSAVFVSIFLISVERFSMTAEMLVGRAGHRITTIWFWWGQDHQVMGAKSLDVGVESSVRVFESHSVSLLYTLYTRGALLVLADLPPTQVLTLTLLV